jgi:hypothetical protein
MDDGKQGVIPQVAAIVDICNTHRDGYFRKRVIGWKFYFYTGQLTQVL